MSATFPGSSAGIECLKTVKHMAEMKKEGERNCGRGDIALDYVFCLCGACNTCLYGVAIIGEIDWLHCHRLIFNATV